MISSEVGVNDRGMFRFCIKYIVHVSRENDIFDPSSQVS